MTTSFQNNSKKYFFFVSMWIVKLFYVYLNSFCSFCFRLFFLFSYLSVFGEIQRPLVCLLSCDMYIEKVYLGVPVSRQVVLHNQSLLKARFTWKEVGATLKGLLSILNPAERYCFSVAFM